VQNISTKENPTYMFTKHVPGNKFMCVYIFFDLYLVSFLWTKFV